MNRYHKLFLSACLAAPLAYASSPTTGPSAAASPTSAPSAFSNELDRLSYSLGADLGRNLKQQDIRLNLSVFEEGFRAGIEGKNLKLSAEEMRGTLVQFQQKLMTERVSKMKKVAENNLSASKKFLEENSKKEGVQNLASGIHYKIIKEGNGAKPAATDRVTVNYEGRLPDGTVFDSSYKRGKPVTFKLNEVISGWQTALQKMPVGSSWEIYLAPEVAYGEQGAGGPIGPNQALIFKIELLSTAGK